MSSTKEFPTFATNIPGSDDRPRETVADALNATLSHAYRAISAPHIVRIASAYFNPQGFLALQTELSKAHRVQILLGAEPLADAAAHTTAGIQNAAMARDRDATGFTHDASAAAQQLIAWLARTDADGVPIVEVRRFEQGFLHGKAFIVGNDHISAAMSGSSNFTAGGLLSNRELNIGTGSHQDTNRKVREWFDRHWHEAQPFDLGAFYAAKWVPHAPYTVFLRMLHELYQHDDDDLAESALKLTGFQRDGVARALRLLAANNGVIVCDEVGLGKTFIAGEIIHRTTRVLRQQVLLIVPAALKSSTWEPFLKKYDLEHRVEVVTYDAIRHDNNGALMRRMDDFSTIIIDEAHNLRNQQTQRSNGLKALLEGRYRKQMVLLTATPVNNSLDDLLGLMSYFIRNDGHFAAQNIPSLKNYFRKLSQTESDQLNPDVLFDVMDQITVRRTRQFIKLHYAGELITGPTGELEPIVFPMPRVHRVDYHINDASEVLLRAMIHALQDTPRSDAVARSVVLERAPLTTRALHTQLLALPAEISEPDQDDTRERTLDRLRRRGNDPRRLSMARYMPSIYATNPEDLELSQQITSTGLLQSALLKRLESSATALKGTLLRLRESHETFLKALHHGAVLTGQALIDGIEHVADEDFDDFIVSLDTDSQLGSDRASAYDMALLKCYVEQDVALLTVMIQLADAVISAGEPKIPVLNGILSDTVTAARLADAQVSEGDRRKVIVFSTFKDTIEMLHAAITKAVNAAPEGSPLAAYRHRIAPVISGSRGGIEVEARTQAVAEFTPKTAGQFDSTGASITPDTYDLLFTTDVLAEGVNLQQAGRIVSVDLPWNPMKLVQRHGRIDRLFSSHREVHLYCFFPAKKVDELLGLENTLHRKIAFATAAIGNISVLPGTIERLDANYADTRSQIEGILGGKNDLFTTGGIGVLSGEVYRRRLQSVMGSSIHAGDPDLRQAVLGLPAGAGSGFRSPHVRQNGYVFCARIKGHSKPWFRYVVADGESWEPLIEAETGKVRMSNDTASALRVADPEQPTIAADIPAPAAAHVFAAWEHARDDIYATWTALTDVANMSPDISRVLLRARQILLDHGAGIPRERRMELAGLLSSNWDYRVTRNIRNIITAESSAEEKLRLIDVYFRDSGLVAPPPPEPLPPITPADIDVICWMAVATQR